MKIRVTIPIQLFTHNGPVEMNFISESETEIVEHAVSRALVEIDCLFPKKLYQGRPIFVGTIKEVEILK